MCDKVQTEYASVEPKIHCLGPQDTRMRYDCRHKTDTRLRDAKVAQLQCAAGDPNERADPDFCDACTQGMGGDQPGTPGRPGECRGGDGNYAQMPC